MAKAPKKNKALKGLEAFAEEFSSSLIDPKTLIRTDEQVLRTGSLKLDLLLRGGFRAGTISELFGGESSAKTTIALTTARVVLAKGGSVLYIDLEKSLDGGTFYKGKGKIRGWMEILGVAYDDPNFIVSRPGTGEEVYEMIEKAVIGGVFDLIVLDSMAALVPRADAEGNIGESAFGKVAKLNSEALKRVLVAYDKQKVLKTHFMIINQMRDDVGNKFKGATRTPGGRALKHFVRTRLRFTRSKDSATNTTKITIRVEKNAFSPPWETTELFIHPEHGLDLTMELIQFGKEQGFISETSAGRFVLYDMLTGEELAKAHGAKKLREELDSREDYRLALITKIWDDGINTLIGIPKGTD